MKFDLILADVPWSYDDKRTSKSMGMALSAYNTMSVEELCSIGPLVQAVAAKDCLLAFWGVWPKLKEAFQIIEAWGFQYRTIGFVWVKTNPSVESIHSEKDIYSGLGHWTNGNTEFVLLAKRGAPKRVAKNVKQIVVAPRSRHSEKPIEVHRRLEALLGDCNRLEMFARRPVPGWHTIGNELEPYNDIRVDLENLAKA